MMRTISLSRGISLIPHRPVEQYIGIERQPKPFLKVSKPSSSNILIHSPCVCFVCFVVKKTGFRSDPVVVDSLLAKEMFPQIQELPQIFGERPNLNSEVGTTKGTNHTKVWRGTRSAAQFIPLTDHA
jgi:hypothetical protein